MSTVEREEGGRRRSDAVEMEDEAAVERAWRRTSLQGGRGRPHCDGADAASSGERFF